MAVETTRGSSFWESPKSSEKGPVPVSRSIIRAVSGHKLLVYTDAYCLSDRGGSLHSATES
jgi:hypothetical protein